MLLSIFEQYEFLDTLTNTIYLNSKCGELFIDVLNNYSEIKNRILTALEDHLKNVENHQIKNYIQSFLYDSSSTNKNLKFFYNIVQHNFEDITENFNNKSANLSNILKSINTTLLKTSEKEKNYYWLIEYKKQIEEQLKEYSIKALYSIQGLYLDSLLHDLTRNFDFINEYKHNKNNYYFKAFELPRAQISCVIRDNKSIRLLESKNEFLCGYADERNSIENDSNNKIECLTSYMIEKPNDIFEIYRKLIMDNKICINKCLNCGKYFITESRTDEKYCNNPSPQNIDKTCKQYGAKKTYRESIKLSPFKDEHNRTSQFFRMRIHREKDKNKKELYVKQFNLYKEKYLIKKIQYNNKSLREQDFVNWIKKQREKHISSKINK